MKIDKMASFSAHQLKDLPARTCIIENKESGEWEQMAFVETLFFRDLYT
jgi:hypothetical protein